MTQTQLSVNPMRLHNSAIRFSLAGHLSGSEERAAAHQRFSHSFPFAINNSDDGVMFAPQRHMKSHF